MVRHWHKLELVEGYLLGEDTYPSSNLRQEIQMEKTIKYLLQEAYVDGYKDGYDAASKEVEKSKEWELLYAQSVEQILVASHYLQSFVHLIQTKLYFVEQKSLCLQVLQAWESPLWHWL